MGIVLAMVSGGLYACIPAAGCTPIRPVPLAPVPLAPRGEQRIAANCITPVHFSDQGRGSRSGPVTIIPIYWGSEFTQDTMQGLSQFYKQLESSLYYGWIRTEYNAPVLSDFGPQWFKEVQPQSGAISGSTILTQLESWINRDEIPYAEHPLYVIHMPPGTTVSKDDGSQCSTFTAYNGYHTATALPNMYRYFYAVMPDVTGCPSFTPFTLAERTLLESHEIIENVTDNPGDAWTDTGGGWEDPNQPKLCGNQLGDLCSNEADTIQTPFGSATVQKMWSNQVGACVTENFIVPSIPLPGANVAAIEQSPTSVDALVVSADGSANLAWEIENKPWVSFATLASGIAPAGAPIAVDRQNGSQLDAFVVGNDGAVHVMWENSNSAWAGPLAITQPGLLAPGAHIATGQQGGNQLDIFYVDKLGNLNVQWVVGFGAWSKPLAIQSLGPALAGAPLATGHQGAGQLDVFYVDGSGTAKVMAVVGNGAWAGPWALSGAGFAPAGAPLATAPQGPGQLDLFLADVHGDMNVAWVVGTGAWGGPARLTTNGLAGPGANVAAAQQGDSQADVFYVDVNGQVEVQWTASSGWTGPAPISLPHAAPPGAPIAVTTQGASQLDAFVVGYDGLDVMWETNNSAWVAPVAVLPPFGHAAPLAAPVVTSAQAASSTSPANVTWTADPRSATFFVSTQSGTNSPQLPGTAHSYLLSASPTALKSGVRVCAYLDGQSACSGWATVTSPGQPACTVARSCQGILGAPPDYSVTCQTAVDFFLPAPPDGHEVQVATGTQFSGSTSDSGGDILACVPGAPAVPSLGCVGFSTYSGRSDWCPGPPAPTRPPPAPGACCRACLAAGGDCSSHPDGSCTCF